MKLPKIVLSRSVVLLIAALSMGGLSAFGVKRFIERQVEEVEARGKGKMVRVLVPKEDLAKGAPLTDKLVATREVPADWAHSNAITPQQFERVENQKLAYPAARGEMILWSMLEGQRAPSFSARLPAGRRAITVPVDEVNSISGMLQPGDRIDLMVSARKDNRAYMFPLLQNVVVLATGSQAVPAGAGDGKESRRTYTTITLDASPQDAQRVLAAREVGKLAALLRAPGDGATAFSSRRDAMALLGLSDAERAPIGDASVPVLYGGTRDALKDLPRLGGPAAPAAPAAAAPPAAPSPRIAGEIAAPLGAAVQAAVAAAR
jgi:pilus assembly protein CpaB